MAPSDTPESVGTCTAGRRNGWTPIQRASASPASRNYPREHFPAQKGPARGADSPCLQPAKSNGKARPALPADSLELERRLRDYNAKLAEDGLCMAGVLVQ
jgi:hypothetical protein